MRWITSTYGNDLRACFDFVSKYLYIAMSIYPSGDWAVPFATEMIQQGRDNCYLRSAFCALAGWLGYDAKVISGHVLARSGLADGSK